MDPSTGTFTSMDTYAGSLSDPISLHKYLFANSNPVKYCDPSGYVTLAEFDVAMGIMFIMEASMTAYVIGTIISYDVQGKDIASQEGVSDFLMALIGGALLGLVAGLSITGVFAIVMVGIFAQLITILAITTIFIGMGLVLSEMWTVKIGIEISIGGEMKFLADIGVLLSPDGGISISHSPFGGGLVLRILISLQIFRLTSIFILGMLPRKMLII